MPLTPKQRAHLERRLKEERARLLQDLGRFTGDERDESETDRAGDLSTLPFHLADRGTTTMETELAASNATRQSAELAEIDAALARLYASPERFGLDEETGEEIPFERLDVIPWARRRAPKSE
jgi:RNA polymerase-binding transcription factor DksA